MSTTELRKLLIAKIQVTDDDKLLEEASRLLDIKITESDMYKLSEKQREAIEEGRRQIANGEYLTDEESNNQTDEWLSK